MHHSPPSHQEQKGQAPRWFCPHCHSSCWCNGRLISASRTLGLLLLFPNARIVTIWAVIASLSTTLALLHPLLLSIESLLLPHSSPLLKPRSKPFSERSSGYDVEAGIIRLSRIAIHSDFRLNEPTAQMFSNCSAAAVNLVPTMHQSKRFAKASVNMSRWGLLSYTTLPKPFSMVSHEVAWPTSYAVMKFSGCSDSTDRKISFWPRFFHEPNCGQEV